MKVAKGKLGSEETFSRRVSPFSFPIELTESGLYTVLKMVSKLEASGMLKDGTGMHPQTKGKKGPQFLCAMAASLVLTAGGTVLGWSSPALSYLQSPNSSLPVTPDEGSWIGSLVAIGCFVGALPAGPMADMIGRKMTIMSLNLPLIVSWAAIYFATGVKALYAARLMGGLSIGASFAVVPMYIAEIAEDSLRGALSTVFNVMLVSGILFVFVLGVFCSYQTMTLLCGILPVLGVLAMLKAPESPSYLLKERKRDAALKSITTLRGSSFNSEKYLRSMEANSNKEGGNGRSACQVVKTRAGWMSLVITLGLMIFQQMVGINAVVFFAGPLFEATKTPLDPSVGAVLVGLAQLFPAPLAMYLIDRAGRKILLQLSIGVCAVSLALVAFYFQLKEGGSDVSHLGLLPVISVLTYIFAFAIGLGGIPWMMCAEILPEEIKGVSTGVATALNWFLAFVVTKIFQPMATALGFAFAFWFFTAWGVAGFIFTTILVIETKGKSLSQIQDELARKRR